MPFTPFGVAQGWSPSSYASAVAELQRMGYTSIALGGMVPLKTAEIFACLRAIANVRLPTTRLHLLGVTRTGEWSQFAALGVASFDSTTPLRQAFKDDKDNYYTLDTLRPTWPAIRVPQVDGNARMLRCVMAGFIRQEEADALESGCLAALRRFEDGQANIDEVAERLERYEELFQVCEDRLRPPGKKPGKPKSRTAEIRATLAAAPWRQCPCAVCRDLRHHVILFRGAERNRRRGFHNIWVFYQRLQRDLQRGQP